MQVVIWLITDVQTDTNICFLISGSGARMSPLLSLGLALVNMFIIFSHN